MKDVRNAAMATTVMWSSASETGSCMPSTSPRLVRSCSARVVSTPASARHAWSLTCTPSCLRTKLPMSACRYVVRCVGGIASRLLRARECVTASAAAASTRDASRAAAARDSVGRHSSPPGVRANGSFVSSRYLRVFGAPSGTNNPVNLYKNVRPAAIPQTHND